jgi:hypothetical protein
MSAYDNDPRVRWESPGDWSVGAYSVHVLPDIDIPAGCEDQFREWSGVVVAELDGWHATIRDGASPFQVVGVYPTADEAIRSLIGDPQ